MVSSRTRHDRECVNVLPVFGVTSSDVVSSCFHRKAETREPDLLRLPTEQSTLRHRFSMRRYDVARSAARAMRDACVKLLSVLSPLLGRRGRR
jgi:hypothetical protein